MKTLLIVEDDEFFKVALKNKIIALGFKVIEADGKTVQDILMKPQTLHGIISDIQMPYLTGVELLEWYKKSHSTLPEANRSLPFILMTGFSHLIETQKAFELGANGFLSKPFESKDLVKCLVDTHLLDDDQKSEQTDKIEYAHISINYFNLMDHLPFDVYFKFNESSMILFGRKGDRISFDKLRDYKSKGMVLFLVRKDQLPHSKGTA